MMGLALNVVATIVLAWGIKEPVTRLIEDWPAMRTLEAVRISAMLGGLIAALLAGIWL